MKLGNLKKAAELHDKSIKYQMVLDDIKTLRLGKDDDGDRLVSDSNNLSFYEGESQLELDLDFDSFDISIDMLDAIEALIHTKVSELIDEVEGL